MSHYDPSKPRMLYGAAAIHNCSAKCLRVIAGTLHAGFKSIEKTDYSLNTFV